MLVGVRCGFNNLGSIMPSGGGAAQEGEQSQTGVLLLSFLPALHQKACGIQGSAPQAAALPCSCGP